MDIRKHTRFTVEFQGSFSSGQRLEGEGTVLNLSLGVKMVHVPYKGENTAVADVLGGQLPFMFSSLPVSLPLAKAGKLRHGR